MSFLSSIPIIGDIASDIGGLFGDNNRASESQPYIDYSNQLKDLSTRLQPYIDEGKSNLDLLNQYTHSKQQDPWSLIDSIGEHYKMSPYETSLVNNVQDMLNRNAAQTGMLGSSSQQRLNENTVANMMGRFQDNYLQRVLDQSNLETGRKLGIERDLASMGGSSLLNQLRMLTSGLQANLTGGIKGAQEQNQQLGDDIGLGSNLLTSILSLFA